MPEKQPLGRLIRVDLRDYWPGEATDFTPWLASAENIRLLGEAIDLELEVQNQEQRVGPFRADIHCIDTSDQTKVLIENQIERTDHTHLGQLLTYAAGLEAVSIIWIAQRFTDEHRAALDWLNRITHDAVNFFGLEIELWRIGNSPPAPKFNVVVKPNDWVGGVDTDTSPTESLYLDYWTAFKTHLESSKSVLKMGKPLPQMWMTFAIGKSSFTLCATTSVQKKTASVHLVIYEPNRLAHFHCLAKSRQEIDQDLGPGIEWREYPGKKESQIRRGFASFDPTDRSDWPRQHRLLQESLEAFNRVFAPRVKNLDTSGWSPDPIEAPSDTIPT